VSFAAEWLDLRAPADAAARDRTLGAAAAAHLGRGVALDLGCGTGAACRAFPAGTRWRLVDADPDLLALAARRCPGEADAVRADLADLGRLPFAGARLVTAFALLDLAGGAWIDRLAERVAAAGAGFYAPLTYDGTLGWEPALPGDAAVRGAFNAHQRRDKGLGEALGPAAAPAMARAMAARGYAVRLAASPWRLDEDQAALHAAFVRGVAAAAGETGLAAAAAWAQARVAARGWRCTVGHLDLLALPEGARAQSNTTSVSSP
jgi:SAM-dependent methyltransferase